MLLKSLHHVLCKTLCSSVRPNFIVKGPRPNSIICQHRQARALFTMEEVEKGFREDVNLAAVCQMTATEDKDANFRAGSYLVQRAAKMGAKMVFLPEGVDYIASSAEKSASMAEPLNGKMVTGYAELCRQYGVWISLGGVHEMGPVQPVGDKIYCAHVLLNPEGEIASVYRKAHLFQAQIEGRMNLQESSYVLHGEHMSKVVDTPLGKVAPMVCYDVRFPEMSTALTQQGAEILTYPSAFTQLTGMAHWEVLLRSRAIENQCYVIAAAQTGKHHEKRASYGRAMIVDPWGCIVACCHDGLDVAVADIDLSYLRRVRTEMPVMQHRRHDLCGRLEGSSSKTNDDDC
ncbi:deaminated glutathione amidase-like [Patiria miniata]|uniref:CN hydrolase domain-containing protein n=1 Tax=Patiria miniata TaxID=46514 RepID=A0A914AYG5_PATMI|nr:deaminated glutathione amidase-like [Patiria miniata]XP_038068292.1 deaminated glutathione amidase-like [Patiria miniata]XP_038068293.1 deaminated glutathione amidase-like [Patiria miniata]XP_038068294.1 deaminated glutathione amidase-like [Patiria miniata]XP_038068295.1 deaminated glutathione amidase-like [Patiria miniata]XP_038068296.1 deaminated glutathione amidase-like [Patiria miniata]